MPARQKAPEFRTNPFCCKHCVGSTSRLVVIAVVLPKKVYIALSQICACIRRQPAGGIAKSARSQVAFGPAACASLPTIKATLSSGKQSKTKWVTSRSYELVGVHARISSWTNRILGTSLGETRFSRARAHAIIPALASKQSMGRLG
ncbi:MAG: hypothetical protein JWO45_1795 [Spartobacteria bacterium]|nr:hypothetical protein [Spartobacteria bacterium]